MAIQLAKALGARVAVTAGSAEKLDACRALGADVAISYKDEDFVELDLVATIDGAEIGMPNSYDEVYHDGVAKGDPNLSSAETGAALSETLTDIVARFAVHFASRVPA